MDAIPVIAFAAYSGTGKTTLIEQLIPRLRAKGLQLAVIKHDAHRFDIDREGKDSWRFTRAGTEVTVISSAEKTALIEQRPRTLPELLQALPPVDMVLVEGYKNEPLRQIGISRKACGKGLPKAPEHYAAIVTDEDMETTVPVFSPGDYDGITEFIMENSKDFTHFNGQGRAKMVNVGEKEITRRTATAAART